MNAQAQHLNPPPPTAGVGVYQEIKQPCLSEEKHREIQAYLRQKIELLRLTKQSRQSAEHPKFVFPLKKARSTPQYSFYTIVNFVDHDPAIGATDFNQYSATNRDYNCGRRTYDQKNGYQHRGTDLSLWPYDWQTMAREEIMVVAGAPGTIIGKTDGNADQSCGSATSSATDWNAVYVRHDDGSVAWYGHLKRGSLTAKQIGQRVSEGEFLGFVGSSGRSSGPHLHFEVYDAANRLIDPYAGQCNPSTTDSWWKEQPTYLEKVINRISVHDQQPILGACPPQANQSNEVQIAKPGQLFYFYAFGRDMSVNDNILFQIIRPNSSVFAAYTAKATNDYTTFYWWYSNQIPADAPEGMWKIRVTYGGKEFEHSFLITNKSADVLLVESSKKGPLCEGDTVTLAANLESSEIVWKKDGQVIPNIAGQRLLVRQPGKYTAELNGYVSNTIDQTIWKPLAITLMPGDTSVCQGQQAVLSVKASDTRSAKIQWQRNGVDIPSAVNGTYQASQGGTYAVTVADGVCPAVSKSMTLTVNELIKPVITQNSFILTSSLVSGNQWLLNGQPIQGATGATYNANEGGVYKVQNKQACGIIESNEVAVLVTALEDTTALSVQVYPNPASSQCIVTWPTRNQFETLLLTDMIGRPLKRFEVTDQSAVVLPLHGLPKSTYWLLFQHKETVLSRRLIIN
ncbi:peptidase S8 and S53 subtilisin kexin sedolisin [Fibrisoma limi BUZ 3]|uniref:Peptidase S8 and S53 subtilisin kexin sedolisin n=2 Tax=Fibrisoma limi TaxID=663275 RepID=I2GB28_9BACT|nr:peptidase S8 and S53 subtilisin kexin sedolisin [Fibrisoma limi BUZ 3]